MTKNDELIKNLPALRKRLENVREMLLANTVMFGEIPAPTFQEEKRVRFMQDRFIEAGCHNVSTDEVGNAVAIHPGTGDSKNHLLISAHLDTPFPANTDHTVKVLTDHIEGPGVLDNALGLAAIATLPSLLNHLGIKLRSNLILLGSSRSMGRGDIEGIRFFLERNKLPIHSGIIVEGGTLGRLSYSSLGMLRGVITCKLPRNYDLSRFGAAGAIPVLNRLINGVLAIPIPREPLTSIILGAMEAGTAYNTMAKEGQLRLEIRSEALGMVGDIATQTEELCHEVAAISGTTITFEHVARRHNGGLSYSHPLVKTARQILTALSIQPHPAPSTGELAALIEKDIPGITLGLTEGANRHQPNESIEIEPLFTGLAQLITTIQAIDEGHCDAEN